MKRGQFNFVWIFAILAGGTILVLAIWGAVQTGDVLRYRADTEAAMSVSILIDPLQAGFAEGSFGTIMFQRETRINNICLSGGGFGKNTISLESRSGIGEEWNLAGGANSVHNKYIFSKEKTEGLDFYVFSKPFEFPYEVSDLVFLMSEGYCFLNAPEFVEDEILGLGMKNIVLGNCSALDEKVCFDGPQVGYQCDSYVYGGPNYDQGVVSKPSGDLPYVGSLMWGAIFSESIVYDCNVERLMFRTGSIAKILSEKTDLMDARDCGTNLKGDLLTWSAMTQKATSDELASLNVYAKNLDRKNNREICGIW
jgi:hypothetical protein